MILFFITFNKKTLKMMKKNYLIIAMCVFSINLFAQINNGLKAYYPLAESTNDESGQNNHGTIFGTVTATTDRFNSENCAYYFPGEENSFIEVNSAADFNIPETGALTISLWYQGGSPEADYEYLFVKVDSTSPNYFKQIYGISLFDINQPNFRHAWALWDDDWTNYPSIQDIPGFNDWHHIVGVYNNKNWYIYKNGVLKGSDLSQENVITESPNGKIFIGKSFQGKLDDIRFYDRALTQNEITELYNLPGSCALAYTKTFEHNNLLSIYPVPSKDILNISYPNTGQIYNLTIYDISGKKLKEAQSNLSEYSIDISNLQIGSYFIEFKMNNMTLRKPFIKK